MFDHNLHPLVVLIKPAYFEIIKTINFPGNLNYKLFEKQLTFFIRNLSVDIKTYFPIWKFFFMFMAFD